MKTVQVTKQVFEYIVSQIGATVTGVDVGRTHGINEYTRNGKYVGCHSWCGSFASGEHCYEIAKYLNDAYTPKLQKSVCGNGCSCDTMCIEAL